MGKYKPRGEMTEEERTAARAKAPVQLRRGEMTEEQRAKARREENARNLARKLGGEKRQRHYKPRAEMTEEERGIMRAEQRARRKNLSPQKLEEVRAKRNLRYRSQPPRSERTEEQKEASRLVTRRWRATERGRAVTKAQQERRVITEAERERARAYAKAYRASEAGMAKIRERARRPENLASNAAMAHRRRAASVEPISADDVRTIWNVRICYYCGVGVSRASIGFHPCKTTVDHKLPVSRGGTNDVNNLVAACFDCNNRKGALTAEEFIAGASRGFGRQAPRRALPGEP